jgi:prepilin-type N-terminal cleavage/methylation domain-containing protein
MGAEVKNRDLKKANAWASQLRNSSSGFTLVELMIAVCLLAFGLLAAAQMQGNSIRYNRMGRDFTTTITCTQSVMEYLKVTIPYEQMTATGGEISFTDSAFAEKFEASKNYKDLKTIRYRITDGPGNPPTWKMITVIVARPGFMSGNYTISSTVAAPYKNL